MNAGTAQRYRKKFRKKVYHFLLDLNDRKFRKYRPFAILFLFAVLFLFLANLPTTENICPDSAETIHGADIAASIRSGISRKNVSEADVIALFVPKNISPEQEASVFSDAALYSFYLTGKELSYLAECAVIPSGDTVLYLDGLNYTYHKNRLPFDRITAISIFSNVELLDNALYHVISTEEIFSLFHYISYRSIGIMNLYPKDAAGIPLSDYRELLVMENNKPLTIHSCLLSVSDSRSVPATVPSSVTVQSGFNIIDLLKHPNQITVCFLVMLFTLIALLGYMLPRIRRIGVWFRIYRIRSKKRGSHKLFRIKKRF